MEIYHFLNELGDAGRPIYALAVELLKVAPSLPQDAANPSVKRKMEAAQFLKACDEIANDPYTKVLVQFWKDVDDSAYVIPCYSQLFGDESAGGIAKNAVPAPGAGAGAETERTG